LTAQDLIEDRQGTKPGRFVEKRRDLTFENRLKRVLPPSLTRLRLLLW
jgi:hypothetical protein